MATISAMALTVGLVMVSTMDTQTGLTFDEVNLQVKKIHKAFLEKMDISTEKNAVSFRDEILRDYENRISKDFSIPEGLKDRVGFWFDIYTKYDSNNRIIHHTSYPWIIFKVIDVSPIINSDTPKVRWLRNVKAEKLVEQELQKIKTALITIIKKSAVDTADEYQALVAQALQPLEGSIKEKAQLALKDIRIQTGQKNFFQSGLETSPLYLKGMEEIFLSHNLPTELTRIPFVESSFNRNAVSKVGASGIWQFMDYTGRSFLTVNDRIDERNSPFKASVAAAKLLKQNHSILKGSWPLAITAWNHGPTGLRKAIKAAGSNDLPTIIKNYRSRTFDFASSNFYSEFLAALHAERYHEQIFPKLAYEKTLDLHKVKLARSISAKELLRRSGLSKENFELYNPDIKRALEKNASLPSGFLLMVDTSAQMSLKKLLTKETVFKLGTKVSSSETAESN
ncbi:MAG: lytic transglycosylase domain-containing protein [Bdellovibrio sp.]